MLQNKAVFKHLNTYSYENYISGYVKHIADLRDEIGNYIPTVMPNWDNTPRYGTRGFVLDGSTPELSAKLFADVIDLFADRDLPFILIKAWNEWAEGNYLEPDNHYGDELLNRLSRI